MGSWIKGAMLSILVLLVLSTLSPTLCAQDTTPPETTITSGPSGTIEYRDVSFEWTGSDNVTATADLVYSYKLEGEDSEWSIWSIDVNKLYPKLSDGDYVFKVRARDEAENIDPSFAVCTFRVEPTGYWKEKWDQYPDPEHTKQRVEDPENYDIQGLRVNADFKVDLGEWFENVQEETYWVPAAVLGTPDNISDEILDLKGKPAEAKSEINVLYEALVFIHLCTESNIHNAKTTGEDDIRWEFPKPATPSIRDGTVNCASAANVIHYLLEDDYDEVGYVWRHSDCDSDNPGGHCTS
ncbi:MAG: triple tyrosine motif-containing protein, partial [candidate division WOR-3 bacterium]|nr:triple tyrosine motif-containing protein [candidate division WOR-3 bacterium]